MQQKSGATRNEAGQQCAHAPCSCVVTSAASVREGEEQYCSRGCADGSGCDHETCHCVDGERATG
jgi:hypothetical protein